MNANRDSQLFDPDYRRRLRQSTELSSDEANELLTFEEDFRSSQFDRSLANSVQHASTSALIDHAGAIAAGPGAKALWERLSSDPALLKRAAERIIRDALPPAPRTTITLLLFDPINAIDIEDQMRVDLADIALTSHDAEARGLAVEYLAMNAPERVFDSFEQLIRDDNERARGYSWQAAYQVDLDQTWERAIQLLSDETQHLPHRRSALVAAGLVLPTVQIEDTLSYFVIHPERSLALDAAMLFERYHRTPAIANAAMMSPHAEVREIAQHLMDPYRGSPAAGGSRPGDPTRGDAYANLLRQLSNEGETEPDDSA